MNWILVAAAGWLVCIASVLAGQRPLAPRPAGSVRTDLISTQAFDFHGSVVSTQSFYVGMCDASAAVALNNELFAVANDEDNSLRIYNSTQGGLPIYSHDLSRILRVDPKKPETDLEGACWLGELIFWISSHGRNHLGEFRAS